jgi:hypothetical protein
MSIPWRIAWTVSLLALAVTGALGLRNGITEWDGASTALQRAVTGGVFLYGVLGSIAAFALLRRRAWAAQAVVAWAVTITFVAATAAIAYAGDDATAVGAVFSGLGSALVGAGVWWTARATTVRERV